MNDKMKELREWGTFLLSLAAVVLIPICVLAMRAMRLEMEKEMAKTYVSQNVFSEAKGKLEATDDRLAEKIGQTNGKLDALLIQQTAMQQMLSDWKEKLR